MDNNITKEKYLSIITSFSRLDATMLAINILVQKLSKNFKKIYIINDENLKFFPKLSRKIEHQPEYLHKENYNFSEMVKNLPNNYVLFDPKSIKEFSDFLCNKDLLVISNFSRKFFDLKIHLLLKKNNIKQVQIDIIPNIKMSVKVQFKHFLKTTIYFLNQIIFQKITVLLSIIGVISKVEIKFKDSF